MKKRLITIIALIAGLSSHAQSYYKEDFQSTKAKPGAPTTEFPTNWKNTNSINIVQQGNNKYVSFANFAENEVRTLKSPLFNNIKDKSKMVLKLAYLNFVNKPLEGTFSIYAIENESTQNKQLVRTFNYSELVEKNTEFEKHPVSDRFRKEIDLSSFAGKNIRFEFEMLSSLKRSILYMDEVELLVDNTLSTSEAESIIPKIEFYLDAATNSVILKNITAPIHVEIYTPDGRMISTQKVNDKVDVSQLSKGIYLLQIRDKSGKKYMKKIIKR